MSTHGRPKGECPRLVGMREAQCRFFVGRRAAPGVHTS